MARVFISYRRDDTGGYAGWLADDLRDRLGETQVFMDVDSLRPGVNWVAQLQNEVTSCDVLVAMIGRHWLTAEDDQGNRRLTDPHDYVRLEIEAALERDILVVPALVHGATLPRAEDLPESLRPLLHHQAIELTDSRFRADVQELIDTIEGRLDQSPPPPVQPGPTRAWWQAPLLLYVALPALVLAVVLVAIVTWSSSGPSSRVVFFDRLTDPATGQLPHASDASTAEGYAGGHYFIRKIDPGYTLVASAWTPLGPLSDTSVYVSARIVNPVPGDFVSVGCRDTFVGTQETAYRFELDPARQHVYLYRVFIQGASRKSTLLDDRADAVAQRAILPGGAWNNLAFHCDGNTLSASVNGQQLLAASDPAPFAAGRSNIGYFAPSGQTGEANFLNLQVLQP
ncbi:MAG TPA: toll/interleukin-1 receptor domain-containing protein [Chloroflexota bacterium]|nr:toll/interleukin-1 receptor domain-containing protein [Chloroflexota bacterium]